MRRRIPLVLITLSALVSGPAFAVPDAVPELPVLSAQSRKGGPSADQRQSVEPANKQVDGQIGDWTGESTRLGGTAVYSRGEYVYQDYLFDDHGADNGQDVERAATVDPVAEAEPRTYRVDALAQAAGAEFGAPAPVGAEEHYGDASYPSGVGREADLVETRVAADDSDVFVLARTSAMSVPATSLLLLFDTGEATGTVPVPFGSGIQTTDADVAVFVGPARATVQDLRTGTSASLADLGGSSAFGLDGFINAVEVSLPGELVSRADGTVRLLAATGVVDAAGTGFRDEPAVGANLYNVAFRFTEPVRVWMDKMQAMALFGGSADEFLATVDLGKLESGATEELVPRPGYYERIFESTTPGLAVEGGNQGLFQHYGLYLPDNYRPDRAHPATFWLHWRGGKANSAGGWTPRVFRQLGDDLGGIVVSPSARGTSTWYLGKGHADFLEVWDDLMGSFSIDKDRVYVSGYSMGGFGSYLLGFLYPDRFAGAFPIVGPPTCGLWVGDPSIDPVGQSECRTPGQTNEVENAEKMLTYNLVGNARNLPYVAFNGTNDELVPISGTTRQAARFAELGYRYRQYIFEGYEHYTFAILDEWVEGARYISSFTRDPSPQHVTYKISPDMEEVVETVQTNGTPFDFTIDGAYWVDGLRVEDPEAPGTIDAETFGRGGNEVLALPEAGGAAVGHSTPFTMHGMRWQKDAAIQVENRFTASLVNLASAELDLGEMGLGTAQPITGDISLVGNAVELTLAGTWVEPPTVTIDGQPVAATLDGGGLLVSVPGGTHQLLIAP
ncbi:MAG: prolyl oligopeptidase family serine peptidase [Actinomycetota bacterium]